MYIMESEYFFSSVRFEFCKHICFEFDGSFGIYVNSKQPRLSPKRDAYCVLKAGRLYITVYIELWSK